MTTCYSPEPAGFYHPSQMASRTPEAWNLAFLSHDYGSGSPPDPQFGVHVARTLQLNLLTGHLDLAGLTDPDDTVTPWLREPAPYFARMVQALSQHQLTWVPLYQAYGESWLESVGRRSHLYREPFDIAHDFQIHDTTLAMEALKRIPRV